MGLRIVQACSVWFWAALAFFIVVAIHQSKTYIPFPATGTPSSSTSSKPSTSQTQTHTGLTTSQRLSRAEKAWSTSVALRHQMAIAHPSNPKIPLFPAQQLSDFSRTPYTLWDFFPATYTCPHDIQRVGRLGDGGKWVCGMSLYESTPAAGTTAANTNPHDRKGRGTIIYSFGVNDESTFEAEMLARIPSAQIFAFDFSVDRIGSQIPADLVARTHFAKVGLGAVDEAAKQPPFYTLQTLMKQNAHTYIDILKIDVEGAEYTALDSFMDACDRDFGGKMPIGQVMIELHLVDDKNVDFERFTKWWERLEGFGMRPTWLEINLLAVTLGQGKTDPRCVEYVWVNARDEKSVLLRESV